MQRTWSQPQDSFRPQPATRFSDDEITAFIEEVSAVRDREAFNRLTARFDGQFISKYKARFPTQSGKFPFGSAGKPYTYGANPTQPQTFQPQSFPSQAYGSQQFPAQAYPPQSAYPQQFAQQPPFTQPFDNRPQSAVMGRSDGMFQQFPGEQGYGMQYQVRTPSPGRMHGQRFDQMYSAPMYDRAPEVRPPSYQDRQFMERPADPQFSQSSRFQDYSQPANRQPSPKPNPSSIGDYAELRKMKEEMLARFQVSAGQRPPRA